MDHKMGFFFPLALGIFNYHERTVIKVDVNTRIFYDIHTHAALHRLATRHHQSSYMVVLIFRSHTFIKKP